MYKHFLKSVFDKTIAIIGIVITSPFILITFIALAIANKGNPLFLQTRPGKNAKPFKIIKFKTMNDKRDHQGNLLPDAERLTKIGKLIRKTSLDELPQLINVIKGDISLVGPRPLLMEYLSLYNKQQARRHEIKPGITGWAQINGRNTITWEQKFKYDVWYIDNLSFSLDLKIIFITIKKVFKSEGVNSDQSTTMEKFTGNQ